MIRYKRTRGLGLAYLFRLHGSLLPACLPAMIISGLLSALVASERLDTWLPVRDAFGDTYGVQIFGAALGFLCVQRLHMS